MTASIQDFLTDEETEDFSHIAEILRHDEFFRHTQSRPAEGWLRSIRRCLGVSSAAVAKVMGVSRQMPHQLEVAESEDRITLKSLRKVADALDCDLVYYLVPREGSVKKRIHERLRNIHMMFEIEAARAAGIPVFEIDGEGAMASDKPAARPQIFLSHTKELRLEPFLNELRKSSLGGNPASVAPSVRTGKHGRPKGSKNARAKAAPAKATKRTSSPEASTAKPPPS